MDHDEPGAITVGILESDELNAARNHRPAALSTAAMNRSTSSASM
jgi:hypothetical protein